QILATMNEAVLGMRPDLRVSYANSAAERLLGYTAGEFFERRLTDFLTQQFETSQLKAEFHRLLADRDFSTMDSVDLRAADGTIKTAKMSITKVLTDGEPYGYLVVLTDLTTITQ